MPPSSFPATLLRVLQPRLRQMLSVLRAFVLAESPSLEIAPADRCCAIIAKESRKRGARVERLAQKHRGDHVRMPWQPQTSSAAGQLLVLGHYDTVYASGTLAKMPFRVSAGKAYGPGAFDMKAGIVQALFALDALRQIHAPLRKRIVFLWTSDEDIGSESSRKLIETEARRSDAGAISLREDSLPISSSEDQRKTMRLRSGAWICRRASKAKSACTMPAFITNAPGPYALPADTRKGIFASVPEAYTVS